jgi:protein-tyrosine phosphatase
VTPALAVGGRVEPHGVALLAREHGVRRVVDLRGEERPDPEHFRAHGVDFLHLPTPDHHPILPKVLREGVGWVREGLARRQRILVHCEHGIGRSVLLACCVLVTRGDSALAALERVKRAREKASPSPAQLHALLDWAAAWTDSRPAETWHDLARLAYRHLKPGAGAS